MVRACRMLLAAGGRLARTALGCAGILVVVAAIVPTSGPDARVVPEVGDPERPVDTVAVTVPEGMLAKSLTITDASGRELATLTHWSNGETTVVARRRGGPDVSCWLNRKECAFVELIGAIHRTRIEMDPAGITKTFVTPSPRLSRRGPAIEASSPN
jgi:hypothetical protein